ncbi:AAA family ATPase [Microvirga brassicacearum]|uniref:AAA+ ATPase domain-containing protein n=1 Tax=Microvirga brassicacearum TaxID=2580413 RepID=A0A5N3PGZ4_9HYPH|nr:AAA family ATPase [Microvirga brassicacearum]KAB0269006.1 hypothetical protein FEZ63_02550 [Microvirga brassicacearum]
MSGLDELESKMADIAAVVWGPPRKGEGNASEIRYGGGRTVNPKIGRYFVHGNDVGGGPIKFLQEEAGLQGKEIFEWLEEHKFPVPERRDATSPAVKKNDMPKESKPKPAARAPKVVTEKKITATFPYVDENNVEIYQVVKFEWEEDGKRKKSYAQRRKPRDDDDPETIKRGWVWNLDGVRIVPYRLPEYLADVADGVTIFFVEGEKVVDRLRSVGVPATCNPMGAGKWWDELTNYFDDVDLVVLPDNDRQAKRKDGALKFYEDGAPVFVGQDHAKRVAFETSAVARSVRILELPGLPEKGDGFDWIEAGGTPDALYELVDSSAVAWNAYTGPKAEGSNPNLDPETLKLNFKAVWFHQISGKKPVRNWLLKNLLLASVFGIVYGPPGCGKSFLLSDLCLTMAAGKALNRDRPEWFGYKGRVFGVVYVVAEGSDDFEIRLHAWRENNNVPPDAVIPFVFLPTTVDMRSSDADTQKLASDVKAISASMLALCGVPTELVVLDTVARSLAGGNENDSAVMSTFVKNCGLLQESLKVAVIGVHHGGKEGGRGPRGHESLHGAADLEIEVASATEDTPNAFVIRKMKAGPGGKTEKFRLKQVTVGSDGDGDPVTSCVVVKQTGDLSGKREKARGFKVNPTELEFLQALAETIEKRGIMPPAGVEVPGRVNLVANVRDVRDAFMEKFAATETGDEVAVENRLKARWSRATKALIRWKIIGSNKVYLWMTGKPVQNFHLRGVTEQGQPPIGGGNAAPVDEDKPFEASRTVPETDDLTKF